MNPDAFKVVIVGGGSAGWLTAGVLASQYPSGLDVVLIESPDVATIGVGEGTWPSMRSTLQKIGVSEAEFIRRCDVSLKQGTQFINWLNDEAHRYYHPFSLPQKFAELDLARYWLSNGGSRSFAHAVTPQAQLCDNNLSAKQVQTPEFAFNMNYGYHLNAGKFADFLQQHCTQTLGVSHMIDHVDGVNADQKGRIESLITRKNANLGGDLFIDCTGMSALLISQHYEVPIKSVKEVLFNDTALAVQVPYPDESTDIASCTVATAQPAGWIWDIGLATRRGVGYVFSSAHSSDDEARAILQSYLANDQLPEPKIIHFHPGYREQPWRHNCVAVGLSAGFVEPLEASALVMIERSAQAIADNLPIDAEAMPVVAERFNRRFNQHWQKIVLFLKLHYVLSQRRESEYWRDHRHLKTIPDELEALLTLWQTRSPSLQDAPCFDELFPAASFQYVLYGMGHRARQSALQPQAADQLAAQAKQVFVDTERRAEHMAQLMPSNRELLNQIHQSGFTPNR